jgi:hypothetical protein
MTDAATPPETSHRSTWKAKKKRGAGTGKPAPAVVLNGSNMGPFAVEDEPEEKRRGRPSEYTQDRGDRICNELEKGRSLLATLRDEGMPDRSTLVRWLAAHPNFASQYAHATDLGWDVFAEKIVERATDVPPELANSRKLEIDAGKWLLSKRAARRYGDRLDLRAEVTGANGGPIAIDVLHNLLLQPAVLDRLSDVQVEALRSAIPLLAAPVVEGVVVNAVTEAVTTVARMAGVDSAGAFEQVEPAEGEG